MKYTQILLLFLILSSFGVSIRTLDQTNTIYVGQLTDVEFTGLTADTHYIVVFSSGINNYTFQATGYSYHDFFQLDLKVNTLTINIYEYSTTTLMNSSSLLSSQIFEVHTLDDFNIMRMFVQSLSILVPLLLVGYLVGTIIKHTIRK